MEKIAAVGCIALLLLIIVLGGAAVGVLKIREAQRKEDAGKWQETDGAGREKRK